MTLPERVLVTGGSRGLGLAFCRALLAQGSVVRTIARSRTDAVDELERTAGDRFEFVTGDVTSDGDVRRFLAGARDFDALINNAGAGIDGLLATQSLDAIDRVLDLNLRSALVCAKWFIRARLGARQPGTIVNVSSIVGIRGYAGLAAYGATKAGMLGMTRALARELGSKGFRVNAVLPGYLDTELSASLGSEQRDQIVRRTPLERLGTVDDVTPAVLFLLSDAAAFITGQELVVDGGITC
jgi:3-oxoacyl-[acyl-carrier protein] reductase